jgi:hypothetical protein
MAEDVLRCKFQAKAKWTIGISRKTGNVEPSIRATAARPDLADTTWNLYCSEPILMPQFDPVASRL